MLDRTYVKQAIVATRKEHNVVWGARVLREALIMRAAVHAIMAQSAGCDDAQAIIQQFVQQAEKLEQQQ